MYLDCRRNHKVFQLSQKERHIVYHWEQFLCIKTWHPFHCSKKMHFTYYSINLMWTVMNTRKWTVSIHKQPETVEVKQLSIKYKFTFVVQFIPFPQHASEKFSNLDDSVENRFGYWHSTMWCSKWGLLANVNEVVHVIQMALSGESIKDKRTVPNRYWINFYRSCHLEFVYEIYRNRWCDVIYLSSMAALKETENLNYKMMLFLICSLYRGS